MKTYKKRHSYGRFTAIMLFLLLLLIFGLILNLNIGSVQIPAGEIFRMLLRGDDASTESRILFSIRIPRMLLAAVLGGALSVSGFLLQTFFRNPIAGPFVLGISSGAKMVVGVTMIFFARYLSGAGSVVMVFAAFLGSLMITTVVLLFSQKVPNMSMLLVIGIMVGYICSAVTDFCVTFADEHDIVNLTNWSMGTFSGASWDNVKTASFIWFPGVLAAWCLSKPMAAYALGEGYAQSMGISIKPFRLALILLSSLLSACVTALAGPVSFVGIAVPHITRTALKTSRPAFRKYWRDSNGTFCWCRQRCSGSDHHPRCKTSGGSGCGNLCGFSGKPGIAELLQRRLRNSRQRKNDSGTGY